MNAERKTRFVAFFLTIKSMNTLLSKSKYQKKILKNNIQAKIRLFLKIVKNSNFLLKLRIILTNHRFM